MELYQDMFFDPNPRIIVTILVISGASELVQSYSCINSIKDNMSVAILIGFTKLLIEHQCLHTLHLTNMMLLKALILRYTAYAQMYDHQSYKFRKIFCSCNLLILSFIC